MKRYGLLMTWLFIAATLLTPELLNAEVAKATFAGGCFWCMEPPFDKLDGVISTTSGYSGGTTTNPTYREVTYEETGHKEVIQIEYDDDIISYRELVDVFWVNVDPLDDRGQFCDKGSSYRTAIFYHSDAQKQVAEETKNELEHSERFDSPIVTELLEFDVFYPAEEYHQDYYKKNPGRYRFYRFACGRDARLRQLWGG